MTAPGMTYSGMLSGRWAISGGEVAELVRRFRRRIPGRTPRALAREVREQLLPSYELVYVDHRDGLTDKQVALLATSDWGALYDDPHLEDWLSGERYQTATTIVDDVAAEVTAGWKLADGRDYSDLLDRLPTGGRWDALVSEVLDRDASEPVRDLVRQTSAVLMRATLVHESTELYDGDHTPAELLAMCGGRIDPTPGNVAAAQAVIDNAYDKVCVSAVVSVDPSDLYDLPHDCTRVEITDFGLWLGNPFAGSGWCEEVTGTVVIDRTDLTLDKDGFGYGWQETAGCSAGAFPGRVRAVN